jgi:hypothetical protein
MNVPAVLASVYRYRIVQYALGAAVKVLALVVLVKVVSGVLAWLFGGWTALPLDLFWGLLAAVQGFAQALDGLAAAFGAIFAEWSLGTLWLALCRSSTVWTGAIVAAWRRWPPSSSVAQCVAAAAAAAWRRLEGSGRCGFGPPVVEAAAVVYGRAAFRRRDR